MDAVAWWAVAGAAVAGFVGSWWWGRLRRTPGEKAERAVIRTLWRLAKRVPARRLLRDPGTGRYIGVDRYRSFLEVVVSEIDFTDPDADDVADAVVTAYGLGGAWRPMAPPILRLHKPVNDSNAWQPSLRESGEMLRFNDRTGAMNASLNELITLREQLERALYDH
jgi:hypothetical protein